MSPQTGKCLDLFTIKGVEIRPAENLQRGNKIKISNCLGGGNEPFKLLIKINQSLMRLGSFKLKQSKLLFYRQYSGLKIKRHLSDSRDAFTPLTSEKNRPAVLHVTGPIRGSRELAPPS